MLPHINPFTFGDEPANAGDTVGLQCMVVKGDVPVDIQWRLNGRAVSDTPGVSVMKMGPKVSALSVDSVAAVHRGTYTCLAENIAGRTEHSAVLSVNGSDLLIQTV